MISGRSAPRSKNGCWTCRRRKVKCDEVRPVCERCSRARRECTYSIPQDSRRTAEPQDLPSSLTDLDAPDRSASVSLSHGESPIGERPTGDTGDENRIMRYYKQQYLSFLTTKKPRWSFISGIVYLGRTSSALMNMIMANVRYQASSTEKCIEDRFQALEHYQSGLRDFAGLVQSGQYDPLTILGTLFLLVQFGLQHAEHAKDISRHLEGFNSAVLTYGGQLIPGLEPFYSRTPGDSSPASAWASSNMNSPTDVPARYSNVLNRLGLWMGYMDALVSSWDLGGSVMSTFLDRFPGSFDSIFAGSRNVAGEIWGAEYPATEALDDLQNRPAFDLYHEAHILRYQVSRFRWTLRDEVESSRIRSEIISKIEELTEKYGALLTLASKWAAPEEEAPRIIRNLRFIVPFFFAAQLDFYRVSCSTAGEPLPPDGERCLSAILNVAAIVHENEQPNSMCRLSWALFMACVETTDLVYQNWILERYAGLCDFGVSYSRANHLLKAVVKQQRLIGERVDYRSWIQTRPEFDPFVIH